MKKLFTLFVIITITYSAFSQVPERMSYQAVIRNVGGELLTNHAVGMRISILQGSSSGTVVYTETQTPTTNANGLVSIEIGGGVGFDAINWGNYTFFIKTETDPSGGTSYTITGTSQLLSVPYAMHAKTVSSYTETDPVFVAWNKSSGISITASQVTDFQSNVTNNAAVLTNTAKNSYPSADAAKLAAITGTNTGDQDITAMTHTNRTVLDAVSGINTGDNATNTQYSSLVTNATHTGDVTGATALTLANVNSNLGTFNNITINAKGLATAGSNVSYLTTTGSAASLNNFPILNQNTTGNAATVTTNANMTGDVTSVGNATTIANKVTMTGTSPVSITGSPAVIATSPVSITIAAATTSAAGSMSAADKTKLDGITGTQVNVKPDWNAAPGNVAEILNKPTILNSQWTTTGSNIYYNAGNVGIGTSTTTYPLEISVPRTDGTKFNLKLTNRTSIQNGNGVGILFAPDDAEIGKMGIFAERRDSWGRGTIHFLNTDIDRYSTVDLSNSVMAITQYGNVGIGTVTPAYKLDVVGNVNITGNFKVNGTNIPTTASDGSETKVTAGTNVSVTGSGTIVSPYVVNATGGTTLNIGDSYQGGGIIFWLDATGQHGLIAATTDQSTGIQWYNGTYRFTGTKGDGLYAGEMNTAMIVATLMADNPTGIFAAKVCADYSVTVGAVTYGDWYLPSKYELNLLYQQKAAVGGFASVIYGSSTEGGSDWAWFQVFNTGSQDAVTKEIQAGVRAVRAF